MSVSDWGVGTRFFCEDERAGGKGDGDGDDLPQTVQRINSIVASFSLVRFNEMAIAASATMIVPMWCILDIWLTLTR